MAARTPCASPLCPRQMRMRSWRATWRLRQQRLAPPRRRASHSATCSSVTNCSNAWRLGVGVRRCDRRGGECIKDGRPFSKPRPSRGLPHAHGQAPAAGGQHALPADDTCRPTTHRRGAAGAGARKSKAPRSVSFTRELLTRERAFLVRVYTSPSLAPSASIDRTSIDLCLLFVKPRIAILLHATHLDLRGLEIEK